MSHNTTLRQGCGTRRFRDELAALKAIERGAEGTPSPHGDHYHLAAAVAVPSRKPPRYTGPSVGMRAMVLVRDSLGEPPWPCCVSCGAPIRPGEYSIHHRLDRSLCGRNEFANLILLCGDGVRLCHGRVTNRLDPHDVGKGYLLESWQDPAREPVMVFTAPGCGVSMLLTDDGDRVPVGA